MESTIAMDEGQHNLVQRLILSEGGGRPKRSRLTCWNNYEKQCYELSRWMKGFDWESLRIGDRCRVPLSKPFHVCLDPCILKDVPTPLLVADGLCRGGKSFLIDNDFMDKCHSISQPTAILILS